MYATPETMTTPRDIIHYLLPFVATAGAYSAQIQSRVGRHTDKDGSTAFSQALSDADLSIQGYLEVALLARFPEVSFFSEEQAQSLNAKYFPPDKEFEVLLDPIDGTRSYIDNRDAYQTIVTIHDHQEIVGAICYMPRKRCCYVGLRGEGAFCATEQQAYRGEIGDPFRLEESHGPVLCFNAPDIVAKLEPYFEVRDIVVEYERNPGRYNLTDILHRQATGKIDRPCQGIDGGGINFIAQQAGAILTELDGSPVGNFRSTPDRLRPSAILATSRELHARMLKALM